MLPWVSSLPGYTAEGLVRDSAQTPLTRFCEPGDESPCPPAPQSICGSPTRLFRPRHPKTRQTEQTTLLGFPHLVDSRTLGREIPRAMCSPFIATRITADPPMILREPLRPPEPPGSAEVPSVRDHHVGAECSWCPSEFSVLLLGWGCYHLEPSSRDWLLVQSFSPVDVWPLWVRSSRFAVGLFLGCAVFPQRGSAGDRSVSSRVLSSSFGLPSESCPAIPSQPTAVRRLLSWAFVPYST